MSDDPPHITVLIANEQAATRVDEDRIGDVAKRTATVERASGEISILIVDSARMSEMVREFLGDEGPTDVLAFPVDALGATTSGPGPVLLGEVVICPEFAAGQAAPDGLDDELDLLVAHGVLHLLGHDHDTEERASRMRMREKAVTGRSGARAS